MLIPVTDAKGFVTLHEPDEDGNPGDLVASVWRNDWLDRLADRHRLSLPCKSGEGAGEIDGLTRRVAEVVNEDGGCWTACSGCQESDEGYVSEKYYPYSPIFQCQPGGGCSECGGIGVLWQDGAFLASYGDALSEDGAQTREAELVAALEDVVRHAENRIKDGIEMRASAWRIGLEEIARDARAALNARGGA